MRRIPPRWFAPRGVRITSGDARKGCGCLLIPLTLISVYWLLDFVAYHFGFIVTVVSVIMVVGFVIILKFDKNA